jgi:molecular chaperone DnaK (HSP70)
MSAFGSEQDTTGVSFGIDLGTTNSCIAVVPRGETPEIIRLRDGAVIIPSCVRWDGGDKFTVGLEAYNDRFLRNTCYSVKRRMGKGELVKLILGNDTLELTPAEVSAKILVELVNQAKTGLYKDINDVIITVPAYFDNNQVQDTIEAGKLAGLNVLSIMREPTSAALLYNQTELVGISKTILVYDLGGGTFDISVVVIHRNSDIDSDLANIYGISDEPEKKTAESNTLFHVIAVNGDMLLGGDDIDRALYDVVVNKLVSKGFDIGSITPVEREKVILTLERLKKSGPAMYNFKAVLGGVETDLSVDATDMHMATKVVFDKTRVLVNKVLSHPSVGSIDQIVTVGGSTKSPILQQMLKDNWPGIHVNSSLNPDESVALGAAIEAKRAKFGSAGVNIFQPLALGIGVLSEGKIRTLVPSDTPIPVVKVEYFTTSYDNQDLVFVDIYQGNSNSKDECVSLGRLELRGIPVRSAGAVSIRVELSVDSRGLLVASASVEGNKVSAEIINLLGAKSKRSVITMDDKRLMRWRSYVSNYIGELKVELEEALDRYENGSVTLEQMSKLISSSKPKPSIIWSE